MTLTGKSKPIDNPTLVYTMHADLVALLALTAGVSCVVDAALPVRPQPTRNDNNDQIHVTNGNNDRQVHVQYDEDELWSRAFSAILSQDASAESRRINPDDWRRYVREAHDLPEEGPSSMLGIDAHAETEGTKARANSNTNGNIDAEEPNQPSWNPGHNQGGNRRRFLHVDEIPPLATDRHPRLLQAATLDDLLGPVGPPPPGAATTSAGNDDDGEGSNNRARVPRPYGDGGGYGGNDYRPRYDHDDEDDELNYRWQQGDTEVPGYDNAAAGPGGIMTKKVICLLVLLFVIVLVVVVVAVVCHAHAMKRSPPVQVRITTPSFVWRRDRSSSPTYIYLCMICIYTRLSVVRNAEDVTSLVANRSRAEY